MPHNIGALINRQMRRWEIQHPRDSAPVYLPCVAISRLPHAGGATLGRRVAERLDYGFFGKEILEQIAREQGIRHRILEGLDEQVLTTIERVVTDLFHLRPVTESDYMRHLTRTLTTLGRRGAAVIVGRGAPFVLPAQQTLRILLVAPAEVRAKRLAEDQGLALEQASKRLAELDAKRAGFSQHHFGVRQDDPVLYDLVVNTGTLSLDDAIELVLDALARRFPETRASAGARTP